MVILVQACFIFGVFFFCCLIWFLLFFRLFVRFIVAFAGSNIIIVASMSVFHSDKNSSQLTKPDHGLPIRRYAQQHLEPLERTRRLIPYMTFYIPTTNGDYLPYGPITKQMVRIFQYFLIRFAILNVSYKFNFHIEVNKISNWKEMILQIFS